MIDSGLAAALGVHRDAPPKRVAASLVRQGDGAVRIPVPVPVAEWLLLVAAELWAWSEKNYTAKPLEDIVGAFYVAAETLPRLRLVHAPTALALIAPHQEVRCDARHLHRECKALVERRLPDFCVTVFDAWQRDRLLSRGDE